RGSSDAGTYGDFVAETDDCVGAILGAIEEIGAEENTVVVFSSDNGGLWHAWDPEERDDVEHYQPTPRATYTRQLGHQSNAHFRGTKADIWEGGHRVPFVVRYPAVVKADQVCDQYVELNDVLSTLSGLLNEPLPQDAAEDSRDFGALLRGGTQPIRDIGIHHSLRGDFAIRVGDWKMIPQRGSGGFSRPRRIQPAPRSPAGQLYEVDRDPSETNNVWNEQPKVVRKLKIMLGDVTDPLERKRIRFQSTADQTEQEAILILPAKMDDSTPMVVSLHSWSADLTQRNVLERLVHDRGWIYLFPNFRGINQRPDACGSPLAQQDILDAIDSVVSQYPVDSKRLYLTGTSGGGHMTMLMSARFPNRWKAASAWVGISDLARWYEKHQGSKYGNMMEKCCGGAPGDSQQIDDQYASRSPRDFLAGAREVAIDISAGIRDGHDGSVPIWHSIEAFNEIAQARGDQVVTESEIAQLSVPEGRLLNPQTGDVGFDESFGREHFLRRRAGRARLTIFDGDHEGIGAATMDWFERHP
ncbi:MAG: sulfatase-like hydrolase/transferase, partial [Rubripirellula sp.]